MAKKSHSYRAAVAETAKNLTSRAEYYSGHYESIIKFRPQIAIDQYHILYHLDLLEVLLTEELDVPRPKTLQITAHELSLLFNEWLGFVVNHYIGAYYAAARTLRWIYESSLGSTVALINGQLLGNTFPHTLTLSQFKKWLRLYDAQRVHFPRKNGLRAIGLSSSEQIAANGLYSSLCKFSHLSAQSFVPISPISDLVLKMDYFDKIARYAYRTMDLALYCILKATISQWDVSEFLPTYLPYFRADHIHAVRRQKFPLTLSLLKTSCGILQVSAQSVSL